MTNNDICLVLLRVEGPFERTLNRQDAQPVFAFTIFFMPCRRILEAIGRRSAVKLNM